MERGWIVGTEPCEADQLQDLGDEIVILAAHIAAATHRMLVMIAEFDEREGWRAGGHRGCAEWLMVRAGMSQNVATERVRAARALVELPKISNAMRQGVLSFSKVKALTRIATPENEAELLLFARKATARECERLASSWRRMSRFDEAEREKVLHASRTLSIVPDDDGMYRVYGVIDPEVGALLMRAIEAASDALYRADWADRVNGAEPPETAGRTGALDKTVAEVTPEQRRADAIGLLAERALHAGMRDDEVVSGTRAERYQVMLHVEPSTLDAEAEPGKSELADGTRVCAQTSRRIACDAGLVKVTKDADGQILDVGRRTRTIPPAVRRALDVRDGGCRFPGCGSRFTDAHHIVHWADGGTTSLENLILLCRHHHRLVHEDGWSVQAAPGEAPTFTSPAGRVIRRAPTRMPTLPDSAVEDLVAAHASMGVEPDWRSGLSEWSGDHAADHSVWANAWEALDSS